MPNLFDHNGARSDASRQYRQRLFERISGSFVDMREFPLAEVRALIDMEVDNAFFDEIRQRNDIARRRAIEEAPEEPVEDVINA